MKYDEEMLKLKVRVCSIRCKEHKDWGTFGVMEDRGGYYEIYGNDGGRILDKQEAARFWEVVKVQLA